MSSTESLGMPQGSPTAPIISIVVARPFVLVVTVVWSSLAWTVSFVFAVLGLPSLPTSKQTRQRPRRKLSSRHQTRQLDVSEGLRRTHAVAQLAASPHGVASPTTTLGPPPPPGHPQLASPSTSAPWTSSHLQRIRRLFERTGYVSHELDELTETDEPASAGTTTGFGQDERDDEDDDYEFSSVPDLARGHESDSDSSEVQTLADDELVPPIAATSSSSSSSSKGARKDAVLRALGLRKLSIDTHVANSSNSSGTAPTTLESPSPASSISTKSSSHKLCRSLCPKTRSRSRQPSLTRSESDSSVPRRHSVPPSGAARLARSSTTSEVVDVKTKKRSQSIIKRSFRSLSPLGRSPVESRLPSPPPSPLLTGTAT
ncbi:hypothetical protein ACM66B_001692 [Microbotryomycetes sp. NB124-2]